MVSFASHMTDFRFLLGPKLKPLRQPPSRSPPSSSVSICRHHIATRPADIIGMSMRGTSMGANSPTRVPKMQADVEGELGLEEIGRTNRVASVIPSSTQRDINLCNHLLGEDSPIDFTSVQRWKNIYLQRYERLVDHTTTMGTIMGTKYLVFLKVTKDDLVKIDRSCRDLSIRIFYDSSMELIIVKLMVGKAHSWVGNLFTDPLREKAERICGERHALYNMGTF